MKKIYLTFDIETIISRISYNPNFYTNIFLGAIFLADELKRRELKATFFISLSPKCDDIPFEEYFEKINSLIAILKGYDNLKLQPHLHMKNIPFDFETKSDKFADYKFEEQYKALIWAKEVFEKQDIEVDSFRPGSYSSNPQYYQALKKAGYKYSSIMRKEPVHIDTLTTTMEIEKPVAVDFDIIEYPVTSVKIKSIKNREEIINLSPDFLTYESMRRYIEESDYLNINFHSFSIFTNRFARENHKGVISNNIKYLLFEKPLITLLKFFNFELINLNTLFKSEFINWIDELKKTPQECYFIGN
jgi:hypothetical protein